MYVSSQSNLRMVALKCTVHSAVRSPYAVNNIKLNTDKHVNINGRWYMHTRGNIKGRQQNNNKTPNPFVEATISNVQTPNVITTHAHMIHWYSFRTYMYMYMYTCMCSKRE